MDIQELAERAQKLYVSSQRSILAIAGPPGAGKTTLAKQLIKILNETYGSKGTVALLPLDGYHLPNSVLDARGLRTVKGAPETFDLNSYIELVRNIRDFPDQSWSAPEFSHARDEPMPDAIAIEAEVRLVITEGNYLLLPGKWAPVKELCDETWFLDVDPVVERERLIERQVTEVGRTLDEAIDWVDRSDLANAILVREKSTKPTLRFELN